MIVSIKKVFKRNGICKNEVKANFTVEAAIIVPLLLFTIAGGINIAYDMFQEAKAAVKIEEELIKLDPVEIVRTKTIQKELSDSVKDSLKSNDGQ